MTAATADRRRAWRRGRTAEGLAVLLLRLKGWRVLARRYRTPVGEIDIIARRGRTLAFVEVKARDGAATAAEAAARRQRGRIERAARWFLAHHPDAAPSEIRFDVVLVAPWRLPLHIAGAWREGE